MDKENEDMSGNFIFVYGTTMKGFALHKLVADGKCYGEYETADADYAFGVAYGTPCAWPTTYIHRQGKVRGELWKVSDKALEHIEKAFAYPTVSIKSSVKLSNFGKRVTMFVLKDPITINNKSVFPIDLPNDKVYDWKKYSSYQQQLKKEQPIVAAQTPTTTQTPAVVTPKPAPVKPIYSNVTRIGDQVVFKDSVAYNILTTLNLIQDALDTSEVSPALKLDIEGGIEMIRDQAKMIAKVA